MKWPYFDSLSITAKIASNPFDLGRVCKNPSREEAKYFCPWITTPYNLLYGFLHSQPIQIPHHSLVSPQKSQMTPLQGRRGTPPTTGVCKANLRPKPACLGRLVHPVSGYHLFQLWIIINFMFFCTYCFCNHNGKEVIASNSPSNNLDSESDALFSGPRL